jgi:hypothetical protein
MRQNTVSYSSIAPIFRKNHYVVRLSEVFSPFAPVFVWLWRWFCGCFSWLWRWFCGCFSWLGGRSEHRDTIIAMASFSSPEVELTSGRACTCELDRVYCDRISCLAAIKAENRRTNRDVRMDITRRLEGYVSRSHKMVLYCTDPSCPMRICVDIDRRDKSCAITTDSIDTHKEMCTSTAGSPTRQELLHNSDFVEAALLVISLKLAGGVHKSLNKLVKQYFNAEIKAGLCSELVQDLKDRFAFEGFREGFTGVRHILKEFCAVNPGSVYQLEVDLDDKFLSCSLIPANSLCIIQCSACTVVGMDASHTRVKTWGGNLFVLEAMDGNNCNVPIAIGIYAAENADNYTDY